MQRPLTYTFHVPGNLAANLNIRWIAPCNLQLIHVSAVNSTAYQGLINIGPSTDTDGYLDDASCGASSVPSEFDRDDFVGGEFPHIAKGVTICLLYTYNTGGTNANVTLILTCTEG